MSTSISALWHDETAFLLALALVLALVLLRWLASGRATLKHSLLLFGF